MAPLMLRGGSYGCRRFCWCRFLSMSCGVQWLKRTVDVPASAPNGRKENAPGRALFRPGALELGSGDAGERYFLSLPVGDSKKRIPSFVGKPSSLLSARRLAASS